MRGGGYHASAADKRGVEVEIGGGGLLRRGSDEAVSLVWEIYKPESPPPAVGSATCTQCPIGQTSVQAASSCGNCPAGSFADTQSSGICRYCQAGFYQPSPGMSTCLPCPAGSFSYTNATQVGPGQACVGVTRSP